MKKTILIIPIIMLALAAIAGAAVNDLIMQVGQDQGTKLLAGNPAFESATQVYNILQDPKTAATGIAMQQLCAQSGQELCQAYSLVSNPQSFLQGKLTDGVCAQDKQLCNAFNTGLQAYSTAANPVGAASQFALQEMSKQDPKVGATLTQAYMMKGYVDLLKAGPTARGNEATAASQRPLPAMPTGKAVAEPFGGKYAQEALANCMIGFSLGKAAPQTGDIKNCQVNNPQPTDISFVFNKPGLTAKLAGKGCTFSKTGTKVYIYNSDACSIVVDKWQLPKSAKQSYAIFETAEPNIALFEGRFLPVENNQEFRFEDAGYKVPTGGVLYYKNGRFELDLTGAQAREFEISSYGKLQGTTKISSFDGNIRIKKTLSGFDVTGDRIEIINQFNKIKSSGTISVDARGILSGAGENTMVQVRPANLKIKPAPKLKGAEGPEEVILLRTRNQAIEFSTACGKLDKEVPTVNTCTNEKGGLRIQTSNAQGVIVSHIREFTATKTEKLRDVIREANPKASPKLINRLTRINCNANQKLKSKNENCAEIAAGDKLYLNPVTFEPRNKAKIIANMNFDRELPSLEFQSEGALTVSSPGSQPVILNNDDGTIKMPVMVITPRSEKEKALSEAVKKSSSYKVIEDISADILGTPPDPKEKLMKEIKSILMPIDKLEPPALDIRTLTQNMQYDPETGSTKGCGCRKGAATGTAVSPTGMAAAEQCAANSCSVTLVTVTLPKPVITQHGFTGAASIVKSPELKINGKELNFRDNVFQVSVTDPQIGKQIIYNIDPKTGKVYIGGEFAPYYGGEFGERIDIIALAGKQKEYLESMCQKDPKCTAQTQTPGYEIVEKPEEQIRTAIAAKIAQLNGQKPSPFFGVGEISLLKSSLTNGESLRNKLTAQEPLTSAEWERLLSVCCTTLQGYARTKCGCPA